jgi:TonB family protein
MAACIGAPALGAGQHTCGNWEYSESAEGCRASRLTEGDFHFLAVRQDGQLLIRSHAKDWRWPEGKQVQARVELASGDLLAGAITAETSTRWSGFTILTPEVVVEALIADQPLRVVLTSGVDATVQLPSLSVPAARLKSCAAGLTRIPAELYPVNSPALIGSFVIDPSQFNGLPTPRGVLRFRLLVDQSGRTTGCEIKESSGETAVDRRACEILIRTTRFRPAVNSAGKPVAATYQSSIRF